MRTEQREFRIFRIIFSKDRKRREGEKKGGIFREKEGNNEMEINADKE